MKSLRLSSSLILYWNLAQNVPILTPLLPDCCSSPSFDDYTLFRDPYQPDPRFAHLVEGLGEVVGGDVEATKIHPIHRTPSRAPLDDLGGCRPQQTGRPEQRVQPLVFQAR